MPSSSSQEKSRKRKAAAAATGAEDSSSPSSPSISKVASKKSIPLSSSAASSSTHVPPSQQRPLPSQAPPPSQPHAAPTTFHAISTTIRIQLAPIFLSNPARGVRAHLSRFLMRHVDELDGVVLGYADVKAIGDVARVIDDSPFCHFVVRATCWVFRPVVGETIVGVVNKVSSDHVGLLVHGVFNASIPANKIPHERFSFDHTAEAWMQPGDGAASKDIVLGVGAVVRFTISELTKANEMLTIGGSLIEDRSTTGVIVDDLLPPAPLAVDYEWKEDEEGGEVVMGDAAAEVDTDGSQETDGNDDDHEEEEQGYDEDNMQE
ncbi:hypothetical protein HDU87_001263 [Geranomyces variabilis]|uniref:RPA43 OB domain-containing protein n=1 Tax=Geranomyces variabilis TaxID=109894 RepID=A0AAD5TB70_9FUNG|nr:hypothetical protein HDU87_001263 [Geranomyces variabilis]